MILLLSNDASKFANVQAELVDLNFTERIKSSLQRVSMFLILAFCSLFVPVFHFVLVPCFLLIAVVFGIVQFRQKQILVPGQALTCLACKENLNCASIEVGKPIICNQCMARHILKEN